MKPSLPAGLLALAVYIGCIVSANAAIEHYGFVSVGFGLEAPAGVYFAGLALGARDFVQELLGRHIVILAILAGAALSWFIAPSFALASGVAFLVSEFADFAIYTPLRAQNKVGAVALSNTVGAVIDSMIFLYLAFDSINGWFGTTVGKWWTTIPVLFLMWAYDDLSQRRRAPRPAA